MVLMLLIVILEAGWSVAPTHSRTKTLLELILGLWLSFSRNLVGSIKNCLFIRTDLKISISKQLSNSYNMNMYIVLWPIPFFLKILRSWPQNIPARYHSSSQHDILHPPCTKPFIHLARHPSSFQHGTFVLSTQNPSSSQDDTLRPRSTTP